MLRQSTSPMGFDRTLRPDNRSHRTSGPAGVVIPVAVAPLLRNDSAAGRIDLSLELAEMSKPLENAVVARGQVWFVPRPAFTQFSGLDEYTHSYHGEDITAKGTAARTPPALFDTVATGAIAAAQSSEFFANLGISLQPNTAINTDYIDAYNLIHNFRLASHSSKLTRNDYYTEDIVASLELKPAFWPRNRMFDIVPDYEVALIKGALELDVQAGSIPVGGFLYEALAAFPAGAESTAIQYEDENGDVQFTGDSGGVNATQRREHYARPALLLQEETGDNTTVFEDVNTPAANFSGQTLQASLADIDKARTTQAFARAQAAYAGTNYSGFNNDDVIVADLMQGFTVPRELFNRPWVIDSKTVVFNMTERHATDAANLDDSVTVGGAGMSLSVNVPKADYGGIIMATIEVMPERLYERQADEYLYVIDRDGLPDAVRDSQRTLPVDTVPARRIDTLHTTPNAAFGYEPMNAKWRREFTTLGGEFRQLTPGTPSTTARTAIWQADYVDPTLTSDHWLCPHPFPQDVFSAPSQDVINITVLQTITITGTTVFGDDLIEDNGEFADIQAQAE